MKFEIEYRGQLFEVEWVDDTNFEALRKIDGAHGFVFDENGKVLIANFPSKSSWSIIGGGIENYDETPEDAFIREADEEADIELTDVRRVGYFKSNPKEKPDEVTYQLRFVAKVKKMKERTIDPAEGVIPEIKFVDFEEFLELTKWDRLSAEPQFRRAKEVLSGKD